MERPSLPTLHEGHCGIFNIHQLSGRWDTQFNVHLRDGTCTDELPYLQNIRMTVYSKADIQIQARQLQSERVYLSGSKLSCQLTCMHHRHYTPPITSLPVGPLIFEWIMHIQPTCTQSVHQSLTMS